MVLDLLKERSVDSYYTEEHIMFLVTKMRALLLKRKMRGSRNQAFEAFSDDNMQRICVDLEPAELLPSGCSGNWLKSVQAIPDMIGSSEPKISTVSDMIHSNFTVVPKERMPYVGFNKWLKNIIYASKSSDGHLYITGTNSQFMYLEKVKVEGVFANPEEAASLACDNDGSSISCDPMDMTFPLEDALVSQCIEMVVQELAGSRYAPDDRKNDDNDDLAKVGNTQRPAAPSTYEDNRKAANAEAEEGE